MVDIDNCNLEMYDAEDTAGGYIYHYHGFLEADDADDAETCLNTINALKTLVTEPKIAFLGRSGSKHKDIYYVEFALQGDE